VTTGALVVVAVLVLLFMCIVAALAYLAFRVFTHLQAHFFTELRKMNEERTLERVASQEAYAQFVESSEEREQVLQQADEVWISKPESAIDYDDDLQWEQPDA
jgi:flagellar biosynthesis component FlhA